MMFPGQGFENLEAQLDGHTVATENIGHICN